MLTNQLFYRKYGIRLLSQLMQPPTFEMISLELPMKSIYHYVTYDGVENGPPSDDYLFRNIKKPILVGHIFDTGSQLGNPRKQAITTAGMVRDYHNQNRRMRPLRNIQLASKDPTSLIVYNYCLINKTYKYVRSYFTEYFKWYNTFSAVIDNIATVSNESDNQHYLISGCPKLIPSLSQLNVASNSEINQATLKSINSDEAYFLLEIWKWLGQDRASSILNKIPNNKIHLVNIIYIESGKWCILNLGVLNSFRSFEDKDNAGEGYVIESNSNLSPEQISKRVLKMFMTIMELKTVTSNITSKPEEEKIEVSILTGNEVQADDEVQIDDDFEEDSSEDAAVIKAPLEVIETNLNAQEIQTVISDDPELNETPEELKKRLLDEDEQLDKDLTVLNEIAKKQDEEVNLNVSSIKEIIDEPELSLEDSILTICDKLADDGLLTAGEYRRFIKLSNSYKQIISSDGMTPLSEFIVIKPEELQIKESSVMVDNTSILDKSMLKSSLIDFDSRYIKNILARDTANAVMSVQRAGIAVTNYRVEKVKDILGGYEMHTVKLAPVEGLASTLRFKLPIVNEDGSYTANGIKYRIRKQRGDLPIRKTSYNRVALTSYYGKSFINRGRKKSDDYGHWLQTTVMEKGLNKEDLDITDIAPANTFDSSLKAPRAYTALSMSFKTIKCRGYTLVFNRKEILQTYPENVLKHFEKDGAIVIGSNDKGIFLVLDNNGTIYTTDNLELKLFGLFESFLGISVQNAPVEYVDLVVFGKEIPMGVVLGYKIGFDKLMKILKVVPRRVNAGSRLNLESNEYALAFSDETLIFSRDDKLASIILAGFNEYHRAIKLFSVYSFDKRGVYLNLLDTANLGVRYLREIDLMYNMFIDNITKDLLIEMKEPVTFQGLLFRACEMLLDDQHPDELDPKYMRIKGYERLSGAIYTELVQAIRVHNGKLGKSNQPIEMNPYAVWKRISEDPSKSQVNEINPIKALKEAEAVTFAGTGGRNKRSMTAHTRAYHVNDMGTISESTVDSADVAINIFTSADPQFNSLRGISKSYDFKTTGATALLSTSALLAPGSDRDDPKRVNLLPL